MEGWIRNKGWTSELSCRSDGAEDEIFGQTINDHLAENSVFPSVFTHLSLITEQVLNPSCWLFSCITFFLHRFVSRVTASPPPVTSNMQRDTNPVLNVNYMPLDQTTESQLDNR